MRRSCAIVSVQSLRLVGITILMCCVASAATLEDERRLRWEIFVNQSYNLEIRPVFNQSTRIVVQANLSLQNIHKLDEINQSFGTSGWLSLSWTDHYMRWNPLDYGGIKQLLMMSSKMWKPDITLDNGVNGYKLVGDDNHLLRVTGETGEVFWSPGDSYVTGCTVDVTFYPFDIQTCPITFGSWLHDASLLELRVSREDIDLEQLAVNGQWAVLKTSTRNFTRNVDGIILTYIEFNIVMARKPLFHILNTIMPVFALSLMSLLVFLVPPEAGEKISLSITVLLSLTVFLILIGETMPKTSDSVSLLAVYLVLVLFVDAISVTLSVAVLHFHYKGERSTLQEEDDGPLAHVTNGIGKIPTDSIVDQVEDSDIPDTDSKHHQGTKKLHSNGFAMAKKIDQISFVVLGSFSGLMIVVLSCILFLHQA